jgi:rhamnosyl/mannosyltransferase
MVGADYPLVIAGDGPERRRLEALCRSLGLKNVAFLGEVSEIQKAALLRACYGFVFPSNLPSEAFGVSLLEAAMHGKPMITCEIGTGTSFINIDRETGLVVNAFSPHVLRTALDYLWNSPSIAAGMGENAKYRFQKKFTSDQMAQRYSELYHRICRQS